MENISGTVLGVYMNGQGKGEVSVCGEDGNIYTLELTTEIAEQLQIPFETKARCEPNNNFMPCNFSMPSTGARTNVKYTKKSLVLSSNPDASVPSTSIPKINKQLMTSLPSCPELLVAESSSTCVPHKPTEYSCSQPHKSSTLMPPTQLETIPGNRGKKLWTRTEIKCLLNAYKDSKEKMHSTSFKNDTVWEIISKEMIECGFFNNASQCKFKFNALKRKYTATKDNNRKSGAARMDFEYMEEFDELFQRDHSVTPPSRAESNRSEPIITENTATSAVRRSETENEEDIDFPVTTAKRRRRTISESLISEMEKMTEARENRDEARRAERRAEQELRIRQHSEIISAISESTQAYKEVMPCFDLMYYLRRFLF